MNAEANVVLEERRGYTFTDLDLGEGQNGSVEREADGTGGQDRYGGLHDVQRRPVRVHERQSSACSTNLR